MATVSVNPPKTPVTKGSSGIAAATVPNVCKMPGPPAPFVPTPLPNIGKSGDSPKGYSKKVKVEGQPVAIKGASFKSMGDIASKGTGGGLVSSNTHGPTKFIGPGSFDVKIEGKNVQYLGDPMLNNCGPSGSPANSATLTGELQMALMKAEAANPGGANVCGTGKHSEETYFPDVPENEATVEERLNACRALAKTGQDMYEIVAAEHNYRSGNLSHGQQISRPVTPAEKAAGNHRYSQSVMAICTVCGYMREIDHAKDKNNLTEAKYKNAAIVSGDQRKNNVAFAVKKGNSVTYKAPWASSGKLETFAQDGLQFIATGHG